MSGGLGRRVFQARLSLSSQLGYNVTQTAVGKALGITGTSVGRYEAGLKEPDLEMVERLSMVLRTTPCYLAFGCLHEHTGGRDVTDEDEEHGPPLPVHPPKRQELEDEDTGPAVPPVPFPRRKTSVRAHRPPERH